MPILFPVGDDHVAWPPGCPRRRRRCASAPSSRSRSAATTITCRDAWPRPPAHVVRGELRSPAFAPVLAGVASARVREKQAACAGDARCSCATPSRCGRWLAGRPRRCEPPPRDLLERAWRQLFSTTRTTAPPAAASTRRTTTSRRATAGPSSSAAPRAIRRCAAVHVAPAPDATAHRPVAFHPGPAARARVVERGCRARSTAIAGRARRRRRRAAGAGPRGGDAAAPLRGRVRRRPSSATVPRRPRPAHAAVRAYLTGIIVRDDGAGPLRLDVGLGDAPVRPACSRRSAAGRGADRDAGRRFRVVLHGGARRRGRCSSPAGRAPAAGFVAVGRPPRRPRPTAARLAPRSPRRARGRSRRIFAGSLVVAEPDGSLLIAATHRSAIGPAARQRSRRRRRSRRPLPLRSRRARRPAAPTPAPRSSRRARCGPGCASSRTLELPAGPGDDRATRAAAHHGRPRSPPRSRSSPASAASSCRHHARQRGHAITACARSCTRPSRRAARRRARPRGGGAARSIPPTLGRRRRARRAHRPAPRFVDISDGAHGVALMSRGLPEHEVVREATARRRSWPSRCCARSAGWRAAISPVHRSRRRPDAADARRAGAGPAPLRVRPPAAPGDWAAGGVLADASHYG